MPEECGGSLSDSSQNAHKITLLLFCVNYFMNLYEPSDTVEKNAHINSYRGSLCLYCILWFLHCLASHAAMEKPLTFD